MNENSHEVELLTQRIREVIPKEEFGVWPGGWPNKVEAALIDSVFSVRARYGTETSGVRKVVTAWSQHRGSEMDDLQELAAFNGREPDLLRILGNRQTLSGGMSKAGGAAAAAAALVGAGARHAGDIDGSDEQRSAWVGVTGLGEVTWSYFLMLLGKSGVKADVMIRRFVAKALNRDSVTASHARELVLASAGRLQVDATDLDHAIWRWQRKQGSGGKPAA